MYNYIVQKQNLVSDAGQKLFLAIRDQAQELLTTAGAFRMQEVTSLPERIGVADEWDMIACIDRLVELEEIVELPRECWGQYRIFTTPEVSNR